MTPLAIGHAVRRAGCVAVTIGMLCTAAPSSHGYDAQVAATAASNAARASSVGLLDGRSFRVRIVGDSEDRTAADRLTFESGRFSSELCRKYNFADAPYWIRREGDKILFTAETISPTDGQMVWTGTIDGEEFQGEMAWTKTRWYRTIRVQHRITGTVERQTIP
jgi:hypothetical protein